MLRAFQNAGWSCKAIIMPVLTDCTTVEKIIEENLQVSIIFSIFVLY